MASIADVLLVIFVSIFRVAVRDFSYDLPEIVDKARQSDPGSFVNGGSEYILQPTIIGKAAGVAGFTV